MRIHLRTFGVIGVVGLVWLGVLAAFPPRVAAVRIVFGEELHYPM